MVKAAVKKVILPGKVTWTSPSTRTWTGTREYHDFAADRNKNSINKNNPKIHGKFHPEICTDYCVRPDCKTKSCDDLCDNALGATSNGHLTHAKTNPLTQEEQKLKTYIPNVSKTDLSGKDQEQSYILYKKPLLTDPKDLIKNVLMTKELREHKIDFSLLKNTEDKEK